MPPDARPIDQISTHWTLLGSPSLFFYRYAEAIKAYLRALLRNDNDADEVMQEFAVQVLEKGFAHASPDRGRFRYYLKVAVRNFAISWLRKRRPATVDASVLQDTLADDQVATDEVLRSQWRRCTLDRALQALEQRERESLGNLAFTVLSLIVEHPEEDSTALAERVSKRIGKRVKVEAFRKQVSRARRLFSELLVQEVYPTLGSPNRAEAEEELIDLGLMDYVRNFLPPDWQPATA